MTIESNVILRNRDVLSLLNFSSMRLYEAKAKIIDTRIPKNFHIMLSKKKKFRATKTGQCHKYKE